MAKIVWGVDPLAAGRVGATENPPPFTLAELARIGIPARKAERVQAELARLAGKGLKRAELLALAKEISRQLL